MLLGFISVGLPGFRYEGRSSGREALQGVTSFRLITVPDIQTVDATFSAVRTIVRVDYAWHAENNDAGAAAASASTLLLLFSAGKK